MRIAVIGYGKMGRLIKSAAEERGHSVSTVDPQNPSADFSAIDARSTEGVDVCIDFSHPSAALGNIERLSALGKNLVMGTTGWYGSLDEVQRLIQERGTGFLYASNFSIGVNAFMRVVRYAAALFNRIETYDVGGIEYHHRKKADSPSGTAQTLAQLLIEEIDRKTELVYDIVDRPIGPAELHFASVRCGSIPGTHEILFDSEADTISLRHTARSRQGFAFGAVLAAEWLRGKRGFFTIEALMGDLLDKE